MEFVERAAKPHVVCVYDVQFQVDFTNSSKAKQRVGFSAEEEA